MLHRLIDFLFPAQCAACRRFGAGLCEECAPQTNAAVTRALDSLDVFALGEYAGAYRAAVLAIKDGRRDVADALGERVAAMVFPGSVLVPVRTLRSRVRARGIDGVEAIARAAASRAGAEVRTALEVLSGTGQRGKRREDRLGSRGRFWCDRSLVDGVAVTLVDDVCTTGATLEDAASAIRAAGGIVTGALVAAVVLDAG